MARMLAGLPAEQGTRRKDRDAAKEIKRVGVRAPPSCWLAASFPLFFCFLLRLFSSPSSLFLFLLAHSCDTKIEDINLLQQQRDKLQHQQKKKGCCCSRKKEGDQKTW
ncbi:hypothetical protein ACLB2K_037361 [Fragaria x ananassa]